MITLSIVFVTFMCLNLTVAFTSSICRPSRRDFSLSASSSIPTTAAALLYANALENGGLERGLRDDLESANGIKSSGRPSSPNNEGDEEEDINSQIDYCTDEVCVKLYIEDSRGQKGSAGAFLLLDRKYGDNSEEQVEKKTSHDAPESVETYKFSQTSVAILRKRFGSRKSPWGEWTDEETRAFYKQQLPRSLLEEGALSLSLKERAQLAAESRHALRLYARERQKLPGRVVAKCTDGLRHLQEFGYWSSKGMSWDELMTKYSTEARNAGVSPEEVENYCYTRIVERSCVTNTAFDKIAEKGLQKGLTAVLKSKISAGTESLKFLDKMPRSISTSNSPQATRKD